MAQDAVGFQYREDAERFLEELRERFQRFHLELHPEKTRLMEFGRYAAENRKRRGEGKPESFDFLGFTHTCDKTRNGKFIVLRQTMRKRLQSKLREIKIELKRRLHHPVPEVGQRLRSVMQGHFNPNRKIFEARKRETAALGAGEKLVLGHPLAATIGDSARCMQNLEKVLFTGPKTSDTVTFICD